MSAQELRGAPIAQRLRAEAIESINLLHLQEGQELCLATLLVGQHDSAEAYRRSIARSIGVVGIAHRPVSLEATISADDLVRTVVALNADATVTGILILMPLPDHLSPHLVIEHLSPLKDVDGITPTNAGRLHLGLPALRPSTPQGGIEILDHYGIDLPGQHVVVVGRSNVVGRPMATLLSLRHATVTLCHRQTRDLAAMTRQADIVAVAAGHPDLITGEMIRPGAIVVDFGVNIVDGKIVGDAEATSIVDRASAYTPVPGGTGPVTTIVLARNTIAAGFAMLGGTLDDVAAIVPR